MDTLRQIIEDTLLLAANIRTGEDIGEEHVEGEPDAAAGLREFRTVELVVNIAERLARTTGIADPWTPHAIADLTDFSPEQAEPSKTAAIREAWQQYPEATDTGVEE